MGLRAKVALILGAALCLILGGALSAHLLVIAPQLRAAQAAADQTNVRRVELGFELFRGRMEEWAYDYGVWDHCFQFLNGERPGFPEANLGTSTFLTPGFNGAALFHSDGRLAVQAEVDLKARISRAGALLDATELLRLLPPVAPTDAEPPWSNSGLALTGAGPLLWAATSVKRTDERGDSPGFLVVYRFVDAALLYRIGKLIHVRFGTHPPEPDLAGSTPRSTTWTLRTNAGEPVMDLHIHLPASSIEEGMLPLSAWAGIGFGILVFATMLGLLDRQVLQPLRRIVRHLAAVRASGDYAPRLDMPGSDELALLGNECDALIEHVQEQQGRLRKQASELQDLSNHDALTGLANRRLFDEMLAEHWHLGRRRGHCVALLILDLDGFKAYNDTLGHPAGDRALQQFASVLAQTAVRQSDLACRLGGEEFVVLLPDTDESGAAGVAARVHAGLAELAIAHPAAPVGTQLTVSIGIAALAPAEHPQLDPGELLVRADEALYRAKTGGRNRSAIHGRN